MGDFFKGRKTYISAIAVAVLGLAVNLGFIDLEFANKILYFLLAALGASIRAGIGKLGKN